MGKRSRKQRGAEGVRPRSAEAPARSRPAVAAAERPKPPWHPFPLVELSVLIGIVMLVVGLFSLSDRRGGILVVCGLVLGSLGGLDTVIRDHFSGFRSHTALLAGVPAVLVAGTLFFARAPVAAVLLAVAAVYAGAFVAFRRTFRQRSGGLGFR